MDLQLGGLRALLAGASKGIGRRVAEVLVAEGCDVSICARDQGGVDEALALLYGKGGRAIGASVDIADAAAYEGWIAASADQLGGCDIFMCFSSAGSGPASEDMWAKSFELEVLATWRGIEAALPHLRKSESPSILIIGSSVTVEPSFGPQTYAAMTAAITNYGAALALKLAPEGIRVNTLSPGPIMIPGGDWDKIQQGKPEVYETFRSRIPVGRLGDATEVARAAVFLASPACPFLIGANLVVDGGFTKRVQH